MKDAVADYLEYLEHNRKTAYDVGKRMAVTFSRRSAISTLRSRR